MNALAVVSVAVVALLVVLILVILGMLQAIIDREGLRLLERFGPHRQGGTLADPAPEDES